jgi:hypothetical protein
MVNLYNTLIPEVFTIIYAFFAYLAVLCLAAVSTSSLAQGEA